MKLLFDQNLSPSLVKRLSDIFDDSLHVQNVKLDSASDSVVLDYAKRNDYIIVTKDVDFNDNVILNGFPPKIIWIRIGNCSTNEISLLLRKNEHIIFKFSKSPKEGVLILE